MSAPNDPEELPEPDELTGDVEEIQDPNQYTLRRRLSQILDARQGAVDARREARTDERFKTRHKEQTNQLRAGHVAQAVHIYATELEPLIEGAEELEPDWPAGDLLWGDFEHYIENNGYVPGDCPAALTGVSGPEDDRLYPPRINYSVRVLRYLNRVLADLGLDVTRADETPFSRY